MTARRDSRSSRLVGLLDVGSSKAVCAIARLLQDPGGPSVEILGVGHRQCAGLKAGLVVDMAASEAAVRSAVDQAEAMAGHRIESVILALAGADISSKVHDVAVSVGGEVTPDHMERLHQAAARQLEPVNDDDARELLHAFPACYAVDNAVGVRDPLGMYGDRLSVAVHSVVAARGPMRNLITAVERAHLQVEQTVAAGYASGLAGLLDDERRIGAACIDLGAGVAKLSVFIRDALVFAEDIPLGGAALNEELMAAWFISMAEAERLKTRYGGVLAAGCDDRETIAINRIGMSGSDGDDAISVSRSMIAGLVEPVLGDLFARVADRLAASGFEAAGGRRIVLTGGLSELAGIDDFARQALSRRSEKDIRIAMPAAIQGLPGMMQQAAFTTIAGLIQHRLAAPADLALSRMSDRYRSYRFRAPSRGGLKRLGLWLKENF